MSWGKLERKRSGEVEKGANIYGLWRVRIKKPAKVCWEVYFFLFSAYVGKLKALQRVLVLTGHWLASEIERDWDFDNGKQVRRIKRGIKLCLNILWMKMNCFIFLEALKRERLPSTSSPAFFVLFSVSLSFDLTTHLSFWSVSATTNPSSSLPIIFHISAFPRSTLPIQLVPAYFASSPSSPSHLFATTIITSFPISLTSGCSRFNQYLSVFISGSLGAELR